MNLFNKQKLLVKLFVTKLAPFAYSRGYEMGPLTWARPWEVNKENESKGSGITNSLHGIGLAVDIELFKNGKWLNQSEQHRELGEYWETVHPLARWGGWWGDGNHYSIEHDGVK